MGNEMGNLRNVGPKVPVDPGALGAARKVLSQFKRVHKNEECHTK